MWAACNLKLPLGGAESKLHCLFNHSAIYLVFQRSIRVFQKCSASVRTEKYLLVNFGAL